MHRRALLCALVGVVIGVLQPAPALAANADTVTSSGNSFTGGTLAAPTAPAAAVVGGTIKITWTATTSTWASGYQVSRATVSTGPFTQVAQVTPRTTVQYIDTANTPGVAYFYRLHAYYGTWVSADTATVNATVAVTVRAGSSAIQATSASLPAGTAKAFLYTASSGGATTHLSLYVDPSNTATSIIVAVYSNSGANPLTQLALGTISNPLSGSWNTVLFTSFTITNGTKYWIAVLSPNGGNAVTIRTTAAGAAGSSEVSAQTTLSTLPSAWSAGATTANSPAAAYASP